MGILDVLKEVKDKPLANYPKIVYSRLYKKAMEGFHFEFELDEGNYLFSPYYTLLIGEKHPDLEEFVSNHEVFLNSFKEFILEVMWCSHGFCLSHNSCMTWVPRPGERSSEKNCCW